MLNKKTSRLGLETLEERANPSSFLQDGVLMINGSHGHDKCVVYEKTINGFAGPIETIQVFENGHTKWYHADAVEEIVYKGFNGNDYFQNKTDVPCDIYGGNGHDKILCGTGDDEVFAGHGNDMVWANEGNDECYGQGGTDQIWGQNGDDTIDGGVNDGCADRVHGGHGEDDFRMDLFWAHGKQKNREVCLDFNRNLDEWYR